MKGLSPEPRFSLIAAASAAAIAAGIADPSPACMLAAPLGERDLLPLLAVDSKGR